MAGNHQATNAQGSLSPGFRTNIAMDEIRFGLGGSASRLGVCMTLEKKVHDPMVMSPFFKGLWRV